MYLKNTYMAMNIPHNTNENRLFDPSLELNIENAYRVYKLFQEDGDKVSFVIENIFNIYTYDAGENSTQQLIYDTILHVMIRMNENRNVIDEQDSVEYHKWILVNNLLSGFDLCSWGISIRGAWLEQDGKELLKFMLEVK